MKRHLYAVKSLDENGYTICAGYVESMNEYSPGEIITDSTGTKFLIEFEL